MTSEWDIIDHLLTITKNWELMSGLNWMAMVLGGRPETGPSRRHMTHVRKFTENSPRPRRNLHRTLRRHRRRQPPSQSIPFSSPNRIFISLKPYSIKKEKTHTQTHTTSKMLVLYETALGYCLFKVTDSAKIESADLWKEFESPEKASKLYFILSFNLVLQRNWSIIRLSPRLKLKSIHRFTSTATAVEDITAIQGGKLGKGLKQFLTSEIVDKGKTKESLVVIDPHLGSFPFFDSRNILISL